MKKTKFADSLTVQDIKLSQVWEYVGDDVIEEGVVQPVEQLPANHLDNKLVGLQVRLAGGENIWAIIGNVDAENSKHTEHFLNIAIERDGKWFHLARYHDVDYKTRGPESLANFLGMKVDEVFPIVYDLRPYATGNPAALVGAVQKEPRERLSRNEIIAMAVGGSKESK